MSESLETLLSLPVLTASPEDKSRALLEAVNDELRFHHAACPPYRRWLDSRGFDPSIGCARLVDVPYLPGPLFKEIELVSVSQDSIVRVLRSSGTSAQVPSRVPIDHPTRMRQMRALAAAMTALLGASRQPFVLLDQEPGGESAGDLELSARAAGMRGYLMAASEQTWVLEDSNGRPELDEEALRRHVARLSGGGKPFCLLGYTYMLYRYVVKPLYEAGKTVSLPAGARILHFGGWKRLQDAAVDRHTLMDQIRAVFGVEPAAVRDIYGFTEQLGVIYPDDASGIKRAPVFAEVIVRDPWTLEPVPDGTVGLLEFVTPIPHSYPGNALVLDDIGRIVTRDPGTDGMTGTGFEVVGRAAGAEARGCGDTLPERVYAPA